MALGGSTGPMEACLTSLGACWSSVTGSAPQSLDLVWRVNRETQEARMRACEADAEEAMARARACAQQRNRAGAVAALRAVRHARARHKKHEALHRLCGEQLERIGDAEDVSELMRAMRSVRGVLGTNKMESLYQKFGEAVEELQEQTAAVADVQAAVAAGDELGSATEEAELAAMLESLLGESAAKPAGPQPTLPMSREPTLQGEPEALAAQDRLRERYNALGVGAAYN